jgi:hypothetical protein
MVAMLSAVAMLAPPDLRTKVLLASLTLTLGALVAAALKGSRATYRAAGFTACGTVLLLTLGSFASTGNLAHLAMALAGAVGLVLCSLPGTPKPREAPALAPAP